MVRERREDVGGSQHSGGMVEDGGCTLLATMHELLPATSNNSCSLTGPRLAPKPPSNLRASSQTVLQLELKNAGCEVFLPHQGSFCLLCSSCSLWIPCFVPLDGCSLVLSLGEAGRESVLGESSASGVNGVV